jgi:hypothetical protein
MPEKLVPYTGKQYRQLILLLEHAEETREIPYDLCIRKPAIDLDDADIASIQNVYDSVLHDRNTCLIFREQSGDALGELLDGDEKAFATFDNRSEAALKLFMQEWIALSIEKYLQADLNCRAALASLGPGLSEDPIPPPIITPNVMGILAIQWGYRECPNTSSWENAGWLFSGRHISKLLLYRDVPSDEESSDDRGDGSDNDMVDDPDIEDEDDAPEPDGDDSQSGMTSDGGGATSTSLDT